MKYIEIMILLIIALLLGFIIYSNHVGRDDMKKEIDRLQTKLSNIENKFSELQFYEIEESSD